MNFSIIGPSGYIAHRHLEAIRATGGQVISYLDIKQLNHLDNSSEYFNSEDSFFSSFDFKKPDFCIICSPNHLHKNHIIQSLKKGVDVICEKPICISSIELEEIEKALSMSGAKLYSIMQLRLHPVIQAMKDLANSESSHEQLSRISVITPRDQAYLDSWKIQKKFSGGILFNLAIHYFDLLIVAYGRPLNSHIIFNDKLRAKGTTSFQKLKVEWFFSIDPEDQLPDLKPQRIFKIDGREIIFDNVAGDLHTKNYESILARDGHFDLSSIMPTMNLMFSLNEQ
jgi:UDP-N-acetyl-2-amino-2-deoxyglucuronate dehydrogenase